MHTHERVRVSYAMMMLYACWSHICMCTYERAREREKGEGEGMHAHERVRQREREKGEREGGREGGSEVVVHYTYVCIHTRYLE